MMNPATGQVNGSLRSGFTDPVDGLLYIPRVESKVLDLEITDNIIELMGTNGISVLTLFGQFVDDALFTYEGTCRILDNRIVNNVRNPTNQIPMAEPLLPIGGSRFGAFPGHALPMRMLPLGGIVIGTSTVSSEGGSPPSDRACGLDIRGNIVEDNGTAENARTLPISGIVVLGGDAISISDNRIARNGVVTQSSDVLQTGLRAGLAVLLAGSIDGTRDAIGLFLDDVIFRQSSSFGLRLFGNNVQQNEGRALFVAGTGAMTIENNFFSSLGFHGSTASPEALAEIFALGDVVYVHNLGRPWEAWGLPLDAPTSGIPLNNFALSSGAIAYLKDQLQTFSYTVTDVFFVGLGGQTLFSNNQVIYDWALQQVGSDSLSFAPAALVSLDQITVRSNHFAFRLQTGELSLPSPPLPAPPVGSPEGFGGRPVLTHVMAVGYGVDVSGNRVAEGLDDCEASIFSIGFSLNSTTGNQGTHCIIATIAGEPAGLVNTGNKSIITPNTTGGCSNLQSALDGLADEFLQLLEDRR